MFSILQTRRARRSSPTCGPCLATAVRPIPRNRESHHGESWHAHGERTSSPFTVSTDEVREIVRAAARHGAPACHRRRDVARGTRQRETGRDLGRSVANEPRAAHQRRTSIATSRRRDAPAMNRRWPHRVRFWVDPRRCHDRRDGRHARIRDHCRPYGTMRDAVLG